MWLEQNITQDRKPKLKKYLFLISILFIVFTGIHLVYNYLYEDAKVYPIEGWSISEWLIWDFPSLNPLEPMRWNNGYFMELLYRSLLRYDVKNQKIESDIVSCDISNLSSIECYIKENPKWSNWEKISIDDITSTYDLLKNTNINPIIASLLQGTIISSTENTIIFKNPRNKKDINFLNIFFQPILPQSTIKSIWKENLWWNFSTIWQIYSGKFKITNVQQNLSLWITKFILEKNEFFYKNPVLIDQLIIKLFPDTNTFNKNKETINIVQDNNNLIWSSLPRFQLNEYQLPQYVAAFLNKQTLPDVNFRNFILHNISRENLIQHLWDDSVVEVVNPYMTKTSIKKEVQNKNYENIITKYWYKKKSQLIQEIYPEQKDPKLYSSEVNINDLPKVLTFDDFQKDSEVIVSPLYVDKYNSIRQDDILLTWVAPKWIDAVYINEYKLQWYKKWNKNFYYRLRESYKNINTWINTYKIYFETNWNKELIEEIIFIYHKSKAELKKEENLLLEKLYKEKIVSERERIREEIKNTPVVNKERLQKLSKLDDNFYYNNNYDKLTLDLYFIASDKNIDKSAKFIKNSLEKIWIYIELHPVSIKWLVGILNKKDEYDIILAGINLWYFEQNIFPYFHSSQVDNGFNFSNLKKSLLDSLLLDLKEDLKTQEEEDKIKDKILNFIAEEQVIKTLYSLKQKLIVDKNLKNSPFPEKIQNINLRSIIYDKLYTNEKRVINLWNKDALGFIKYIIGKIYE